ncbi:hypothetical protein H8D91_01885 [archaeon]|nr:hypothetical protein [archaeon]
MKRDKSSPTNQDQFGYYKDNPLRKKISGPRIFLVLSFLTIMLLLLAYPLRDKIAITGNIISFGKPVGGLEMSTDLEILPMDIKGDYEGISILTSQIGTINIGGEEVILEREINEIYLEDFSGRISLDKDNIYILDGKTHSIKINGLKINQGIKNTKILLPSEIQYSLLSIDSEIYLKNLAYNSTTSNIKLGEDTITLKDNYLEIKGLIAKLRIRDKRLFVSGTIQSLSVEKDDKIISIEYEGP